MRSSLLIAVLVVASALGCATMTREKSDNRLFIDSVPSGGDVLINGEYFGVTPKTVELGRDKTFLIVIQKVGYKEATARVSRETAPAVAYMIIGGQAVLFYGEPRLTRDIDITLDATLEQLDDILSTALRSRRLLL